MVDTIFSRSISFKQLLSTKNESITEMPRDGSDGSDGQFRMIIANHYEQMARSRERFSQIFQAQVGYAALSLLWAAVEKAAHPELGLTIEMALLLIALPLLYIGIVLFGRSALKQNALPSLRLYSKLIVGLAVLLLLAALHLFIGALPLLTQQQGSSPSPSSSASSSSPFTHFASPAFLLGLVCLCMAGATAGGLSSAQVGRFASALVSIKNRKQ